MREYDIPPDSANPIADGPKRRSRVEVSLRRKILLLSRDGAAAGLFAQLTDREKICLAGDLIRFFLSENARLEAEITTLRYLRDAPVGPVQ